MLRTAAVSSRVRSGVSATGRISGSASLKNVLSATKRPWRFEAILAVLAVLSVAACAVTTQSTKAANRIEEIISVSACQIFADPARYNHKLVRVTGTVSHGFESFFLSDEACAQFGDAFAALKHQVDIWSLAREGLQRGADGKEDVLVVVAWTQGMIEPAVFTQRFVSKANGGFALLGPIAISDQPSSELGRIAAGFTEGIQDHPKGHLWDSWHRD
jgi:hypothetical protein